MSVKDLPAIAQQMLPEHRLELMKKPFIYGKSSRNNRRLRVQRFRGSEVQGSIFVPGLYLERVFIRKALSSTGLIQNLEPNWQLLEKMTMFNEDFESSMPFLCP